MRDDEEGIDVAVLNALLQWLEVVLHVHLAGLVGGGDAHDAVAGFLNIGIGNRVETNVFFAVPDECFQDGRIWVRVFGTILRFHSPIRPHESWRVGRWCWTLVQHQRLQKARESFISSSFRGSHGGSAIFCRRSVKAEALSVWFGHWQGVFRQSNLKR